MFEQSAAEVALDALSKLFASRTAWRPASSRRAGRWAGALAV
jgi:hypothetical protein